MSRTDTFRMRMPNTSRPPSLHVDDFMRLEQKKLSVSGPTPGMMIQQTDSVKNEPTNVAISNQLYQQQQQQQQQANLMVNSNSYGSLSDFTSINNNNNTNVSVGFMPHTQSFPKISPQSQNNIQVVVSPNLMMNMQQSNQSLANVSAQQQHVEKFNPETFAQNKMGNSSMSTEVAASSSGQHANMTEPLLITPGSVHSSDQHQPGVVFPFGAGYLFLI